MRTRVTQAAKLYGVYGAPWLFLAIILLGLVVQIVTNPLGLWLSLWTSEVQTLSGKELEELTKLMTLPAPTGEIYQIKWDKDRLTLPHEFEVFVNDKPFRFKVNPGTTNDVVIPPEVAITAQVPIVKQERSRGDSYSGVIASLKIGELEIENVPVRVRGSRVIQKLFGLIPFQQTVSPLLGFSFLRRFAAVTLDFPQRTITIWNRTPEIDPVAKTVPFAVAMEMIELPVLVNGQGPYRFMLNLGLSLDVAVILSEQLAQELNVKRRITKITQMHDARFRFPIEELEFGEVKLEKISGLGVDKEFPMSALALFFDGILGVGFFRDQRVMISFEQQKLYFGGVANDQ